MHPLTYGSVSNVVSEFPKWVPVGGPTGEDLAIFRLAWHFHAGMVRLTICAFGVTFDRLGTLGLLLGDHLVTMGVRIELGRACSTT